MAHANRGCKWYINKQLLSQAKLTAEENMHTHTHHNTTDGVDWNKDSPAMSHFRRFMKEDLE